VACYKNCAVSVFVEIRMKSDCVRVIIESRQHDVDVRGRTGGSA
jgi:hypothetical protein